jgi:hypothetical protein
LTWKPISVEKLEEWNTTYADRFNKAANNKGKLLLETFAKEAKDILYEGVSLALYVLDTKNNELRCASELCIGQETFVGPGPPAVASLIGTVNLVSLAWSWAIVTSGTPDGAETNTSNGFVTNERLVVCVPISAALRTMAPPPWGVVRIGFPAVPADDNESKLPTPDELERPLLRASLRLLTEMLT